uniref:RING-type E3 ubiquitin transferase n=1 Tax=Salvator merianae TaxID=96440 RepID=A0A8D0BY46_SALMN
MATRNLVKNFSDEAICSICLEYFKDPVTVDCGHNFCQVCITRCLEEAEGKPSCPQCRETISQRNFRPNRQLTNLVELIKNLQQEIQEEEKRGVCGKHQEPLKLFCKEDRICICVVCDRSKEHKDHNVLPLEEAFKEYKSQIPSLEHKRQKLEALWSDEDQKNRKSLVSGHLKWW